VIAPGTVNGMGACAGYVRFTGGHAQMAGVRAGGRAGPEPVQRNAPLWLPRAE